MERQADLGAPAATGPRILIIAGEASGDAHGAQLVRRLLARRPDAYVYGIGGDAMAESGVRLVYHHADLSVVGIVEVLGRLRSILGALRWARRTLAHEPPDLVVLIDFPDFNLRVARHAARRQVPVVYYISPQIWAWRQSRIRQIARRVTRMLVIFPFEVKVYERHGVRADYVGHPLMDRYDPEGFEEARRQAYGRYGLSPLYPIIGLFPGSRTVEVRGLLPVMLRAAEALHERFPRAQFLLGQSPSLGETIYDAYLDGVSVPIHRARNGIGPGMAVCDLAVVASGTATLELALFGVPMVVVYRVSAITFLLGRLLVRVPSVSLVNLVAQKAIVPELIQDTLNERSLCEHCLRFLRHAVYAAGVRREVARVGGALGQPGASDRAARIILDTLEGNTA